MEDSLHNGHGPTAGLLDGSPLAVVDQVTKTYPRVTALSSVSLTIYPWGAGCTCWPQRWGQDNSPQPALRRPPARFRVSYRGGKDIGTETIQARAFLHGGNHPPATRPGTSAAVAHNVLAGRFGQWGMFRSFLSMVWPQDYNMAARALEQMGIEDKIREKNFSSVRWRATAGGYSPYHGASPKTGAGRRTRILR